jgi:hypothetical protein
VDRRSYGQLLTLWGYVRSLETLVSRPVAPEPAFGDPGADEKEAARATSTAYFSCGGRKL